MMTKKDYESAAAIVLAHVAAMKNRDLVDPSDVIALRQHLITAFSTFFRTDNPRFDSTRFRKACGVAE